MSFNRKFSRKNTRSYKWDLPRLTGPRPDDIIALSVADSDYPTAPVVRRALEKRVRHGAFGYTYIDEDFYRATADWSERRYGYRPEPGWMFSTPGVVNAIYWTIRACVAPGEAVVIQPPIYHPFYRVVPDAGATLALNVLRDTGKSYEIDFSDLEKKFRSGAKMLIFCSPHNPAGRVWSRAELERLVGLARKYDVILASDEIHCDFILFENRFTSLGSFFSEYQKIVVFIAPSKTFNLAGLHFSLIIAPDADIRRRIEEKLDRNYASAANPLSIEAARAAYERGDSWLARQRAHIEENVRFLEAYFRENIPEAIVYRAEGTYLAWVKMAFLNRPAERMTEELIDYGLAVNPGSIYGDAYGDFIRINVACPLPRLEEGLRRLCRYVADIKRSRL